MHFHTYFDNGVKIVTSNNGDAFTASVRIVGNGAIASFDEFNNAIDAFMTASHFAITGRYIIGMRIECNVCECGGRYVVIHNDISHVSNLAFSECLCD